MAKQLLYPHTPQKHTVLMIVCAWCGKPMGEKDGKGVEGTTSSICPECRVKFGKKRDTSVKNRV
jgi:DNA-directed RNA polymerase subunit RPC12/RpoP